MIKGMKQHLSDKCRKFESKHDDVSIWFKYSRFVNGWYILMIDKRNQDRFVERLISNQQISSTTIDIISFELDSMRKGLIDYDRTRN